MSKKLDAHALFQHAYVQARFRDAVGAEPKSAQSR